MGTPASDARLVRSFSRLVRPAVRFVQVSSTWQNNHRQLDDRILRVTLWFTRGPKAQISEGIGELYSMPNRTLKFPARTLL